MTVLSVAAPLQGPVSLSLPFEVSSARVVREALVPWLEHQGVDATTIADLRLVATELVANAVRHAAPLANGTVLVRWRMQRGCVRLSVCDGGGSSTPLVVIAADDATSGRGLAIVEALSTHWWIERRPWLRAVHVDVTLSV